MNDRAPLTRPALPPTAGAVVRRWWTAVRFGTWRRPPAPWVAPLPDEPADEPVEGAVDEPVDERRAERSPRAPGSPVQVVGVFLFLAVSIGGVVVAGLWAFDRWQERASAEPIEVLIPQVLAPALPTVGPASVPEVMAAAPSPSPDEASSILVHVAGAVRRPGLVTLVPGQRIADAIDAAGGVTAQADLDRVNLAAPLSDGQRIYVLALDESQPPSVVAASSAASAPAPMGGEAPVASVDLNTATQADLEALPGVGPATAASIIDHRTRRGNFFHPDELMDVTGIGPAKYAALASLVHTGS